MRAAWTCLLEMAEVKDLPLDITTLIRLVSVADPAPTEPTPEADIVSEGSHINGVKLPTEEPRRNRYKNKSNIVAIDFGTTYCSVAYCVQDDSTVRLLKLSTDDVRVPTSIVIDANGTIIEFGKNARRKYAHMSAERKQHCHIFSEIKMLLQHDKVGYTTEEAYALTIMNKRTPPH